MKVLIILLIAAAAVLGFHIPHPLSDESIQLINESQSSWTAGRNFHPDIPMSHIEKLMGVVPSNKQNDSRNPLPILVHNLEGVEIPTHFDSREKWPHCPTIREIRDQASCGSCWAFGAVEAMSDRVCIHSNGRKNFRFSALDLLTCCKTCSDYDGCHGGGSQQAWKYWVDIGIVSGGPYGSNEGCRPYAVEPCLHYVNGTRPVCTTEFIDAPKCVEECREGYTTPYKEDRNFGQKAYRIVMDQRQIQYEIMTNGPVETGYVVYEDFLHHKRSVYRHRWGDVVWGHAVKIIGWGVEGDEPYWLVANSWNTDWGDNGYFKILRGNNECGIESEIVAGIPK